MFSIRRGDASRSLRTTLLWWLLPFATVFMGVAWLIHGSLLERMSRDFVHERLHQEAEFLERQIRQAYPDFDAALFAGTYFDEIFHHTFAFRLGERATVSHPHWQELLLPWLEDAQTGLLTIDSERPGSSGRSDSSGNSGKSAEEPPGARFLAFRKAFEIDGEPVVILVAEDYSLLQSGQRELHLWTAVVSAALLLFLVILILLAVHIALRPVKQLRRELGDLQAGARNRLSADAPDEFEGLISELNRLLDTLDTRLERSRQGMANLSHSIKTPVAALTQILREPDVAIEGELREQMVSRLANLDRQLETEMHRSRFAGPQAGKSAVPVNQAREIAWMLGRLYDSKQFDLEAELDQQHRWPIEEHDFAELIGNLLDNAGKWASSRINLKLAETPDGFLIEVEDDGPGVAVSAQATLGTRGLRLDEQIAGHGLGLAMVRGLVEQYRGTLQFSTSPLGGLRARIRIPASR